MKETSATILWCLKNATYPKLSVPENSCWQLVMPNFISPILRVHQWRCGTTFLQDARVLILRIMCQNPIFYRSSIEVDINSLSTIAPQQVNTKLIIGCVGKYRKILRAAPSLLQDNIFHKSSLDGTIEIVIDTTVILILILILLLILTIQ